MHSLDSGAPNATTGRLHLGEGVAVEDCTAGEGLTYFWSLGDVSSSLVGKPVIVTASVKVRAFTRAASGSGDREASVSLSIGDDAWTLVSIACNDNGCARGGRARHRNAVLVLRTRMNEAPSTMLLSLDAFAFASGTGSVEASLDATLTSVRIRRA